MRRQQVNRKAPVASVPGQKSAVTSPSEGRESKPARFEELEAYRGVAALLIVIFHAYQFSREATHVQQYVYEGTPLHLFFSNLDAGVAWFFVLSGFLIFLPFARASAGQGRPQSAPGFLIRRAIRIVPLYYMAILTVWALRYQGGLDYWIDLLEHLTFTQVFDTEHIFYTIGPAWSLSVEVLFYIFVAGFGPLIYLACNRLATLKAQVALLTVMILLITAISLGYKWWAFYVWNIPVAPLQKEGFSIYFGLLAKMDTFAIGMLLAVAVVASNGRAYFGRLLAWLLRIIGGAVLVWAFIMRTSSPPVELYIHTLSGAAFVLILASTVLGPRSKTTRQRVLTHPALQFLGLISYSVYIWHEPLMLELRNHTALISDAPSAFPWNALVLAVGSIAVATLSYCIIERPMTNLRHLFTKEGRLVQRYSK